MCQINPTPAGREPDHGDGIIIYRHTYRGFTLRTHRTVRTTPVGWVYGVHDEHGQYTYGYKPTQREALDAAAHYVHGVCDVAA
jgi:hypothetical protein